METIMDVYLSWTLVMHGPHFKKQNRSWNNNFKLGSYNLEDIDLSLIRLACLAERALSLTLSDKLAWSLLKLFTCCWHTVLIKEKTKIKKKRPGMAHFLKKTVWNLGKVVWQWGQYQLFILICSSANVSKRFLVTWTHGQERVRILLGITGIFETKLMFSQ